MVVQSFPLNSLNCLYFSLQTSSDRLLLLDHSLRHTALGYKKVVVKGSRKSQCNVNGLFFYSTKNNCLKKFPC